jgi:hypothetical protein
VTSATGRGPVLLNGDSAAPTKVSFDLEPGAPTSNETLWARPLGENQYVLQNAP